VRLSTERLNATPIGPNLSFDGSKVLFTNLQRVIHIVPVAGGEPTPVVRRAAVGRLDSVAPSAFHDPHPSPDGLLIMGHYSAPEEGGERVGRQPGASEALAEGRQQCPLVERRTGADLLRQHSRYRKSVAAAVIGRATDAANAFQRS
jgi:hypothetical protein